MIKRRVKFLNKSVLFIVFILFSFIAVGYSLLSQKLLVSSSAKYESIPMLKSTTNTDTKYFRSSTYKSKIKTITFEDKISIPDDAVESWDVGLHGNGDVMAYVVINATDSSYFDLYIQANGKIYANENMSYWFAGLTAVDLIKGLEFVDTVFTTNMSNMFYKVGYNSSEFVLDVSSLNTSNVTNMSQMFSDAGYSSTVYEINLSGLDTSSVTNMYGMFKNAGFSNKSFTLDVSGFDTSNVTDFSYMFHQAGYVSTVFTLDVSGFDTSKGINFTNMFRIAGYRSTVFTLDVSNFDTSNATTMSGMFHNAGFSSPIFTLDVSGFDTSKVTAMGEMFYYTGYANPNFTLDVSGFDTSNVTNMNSMFNSTGYKSTVLELDVSGFDTSKVTDMGYMFNNAGYNNPTFTIDVSGFDTSKVTNMFSMFAGTGYKSTIIELDVSNFNTSNVTNMGGMFLSAGYNNQDFTLDVSSFNTSKVTNMQNMFRASGTFSTVYTLDISNFDTSKVTNMSAMFYYTAYYSTTFSLTLGEFDTSSATNMISLFQSVSPSSTELNFEVTIKNPNVTSYTNMFAGTATVDGTKVVVHYIPETSDLVDLMIGTKSTNGNIFKAPSLVDVNNIEIGDVLSLAGDNFNVISVDDEYVTLLTQYNIGSKYRQSTTAYNRTFAETKTWVASDDVLEIDVQEQTGNPKLFINEYVAFLKDVTKIDDISGDLITLNQLKELGCTAGSYDSTSSDYTCANSEYASWLVNGQYWWTKSMFPTNQTRVWLVYNTGTLNPIGYTDSRGIRPVITVPKYMFAETIEFTIDGVSYNAKQGMTWEQWVNSEFNNNEIEYVLDNPYIYSMPGPMVVEYNGNAVGVNDIIVDGNSYSTRMYI